MQTKQQGYILILTLMVTSMAVLLVTNLFNRGMVHIPFMKTMIDREKAKIASLSGLQIAIGQLAKEYEKEKEPEKPNKKPDQKKSQQAGGYQKKFLTDVLPTLNRWQTFLLKEDVEGVDATIKVCIMCEDGKIDINRWYSFKKKAFGGKKDGKRKQVVQEIFKRIEQQVGAKDLFPAFEKFLKERHYGLDDVTELLTIKDFSVFKRHVFYEPPEQKGGAKKRPLYLTDIFTVWSGAYTIDPWMFSDSINGIFKLNRAVPNDVEQRKGAVQGWLNEFKQVVKLPDDWKTVFAPIYGQEFASLPKGIQPFIGSTFESTIFSVLCYGKVGDVTQKLFAIVERTKALKKGEAFSFTIKIKKVYWV